MRSLTPKEALAYIRTHEIASLEEQEEGEALLIFTNGAELHIEVTNISAGCDSCGWGAEATIEWALYEKGG